jgi:uncharacterized membrane protein YjjP (DUF1212 family)
MGLQPDDPDTRPAAARATPLEEVLDTALEAGVRVQMSGGATQRVGTTMDRLARALGVDHAEPSVSSVVVGLTVERDGHSVTAFRRTPHIGINMAELSALSEFSRIAADLPAAQVRPALDEIEATRRRYPPAVVLPLLGVACGAFAGLFGADAAGIVLAAVAGALGATVRHLLVGRHYLPFVAVLAAAWVSTSTAALLASWSGTPDAAVAACVLYLVPGVPLLNGATDLLTTHYLNGLVRLTSASVIVLAAATGVALALKMWGLP